MSNIFSSITQLGAIITDAMVKILDRTITVTTLLNNVTVTGPSASIAMNFVSKVFQVSITGGTATVAIQGSLDNTVFVSVGVVITSSNYDTDSFPWPFMRLNVLTINGATVTGKIAIGGNP